MSFFELQERFNRYIYRGFNIVSDATFHLNFSLKKDIQKNSLYKGLHKGERCFILGTGPSLNNLKDRDLEFLQRETVFGVNSLYKADICKDIFPKYYVLMDNNFWGASSNTFPNVSEAYRERQPIFITDYRAKHLVPPSNKYILLFAKNYPVDDMRSSLDGNISITMNVVGFSILSALYMGFKEIFLLGCDYNLFCSAAQNHCYDDSIENRELEKGDLGFLLKYYALTTEFHYLIRRSAVKYGVNVVNLTPESLLDAYPKGSLHSLLVE